MGLATLAKILFFIFWPLIFLVIFYFKDKEKFKRQLKQMFKKGK